MKFAGYAALFGVADAAGDTIAPGAFAATLAERTTPLPLFWQHRPDQPIGDVTAIAEDNTGLRVIAQIDNPQGRAATMLAARQISGLSFGYRARHYQTLSGNRLLKQVDLFEVSLVTHPLQYGARVHLIA